MNKKILVIEDEEHVASVIEDTLTFIKYDVYTASSGREGIKRAKEIKPDLITLDIRMPDIYGLEILKILKADALTKDIPVIVISGLDYNTKKECLEQGALDYFQKPLDFEFLKSRIVSITQEAADKN
ncbi:PleD family two-component system response regulator [Elusimicrobiota bacterium]